MPRPLPAFLLLTALLLPVGCAAPGGRGHTGPALYHGGGADIGPLTDAAGRRRSLALPPGGTATPSSAWYASRNDRQRSVSAGFATPTYHSARTITTDRGSGRGYGGRHHGHGLRDGYTTRTVRHRETQAVR